MAHVILWNFPRMVEKESGTGRRTRAQRERLLENPRNSGEGLLLGELTAIRVGSSDAGSGKIVVIIISCSEQQQKKKTLVAIV